MIPLLGRSGGWERGGSFGSVWVGAKFDATGRLGAAVDVLFVGVV